MSKVKIGLVQMSCVADKPANVAKAIERIRQAHRDGAQIVCTQELFSSLYFCDEENYDNFLLLFKLTYSSVNLRNKESSLKFSTALS